MTARPERRFSSSVELRRVERVPWNATEMFPVSSLTTMAKGVTLLEQRQELSDVKRQVANSKYSGMSG